MKCPQCDKELIEDGKRFHIMNGKKYCDTFGTCNGTTKTHYNTVFIKIKSEEIK